MADETSSLSFPLLFSSLSVANLSFSSDKRTWPHWTFFKQCPLAAFFKRNNNVFLFTETLNPFIFQIMHSGGMIKI
jgi:hypothetical protein